MKPALVLICLLVICSGTVAAAQGKAISEKLPYNHPGLTVDLGVGLWAQPLPVDYDGDGDNDLLVATADKPSNGVYFFENPSGDVKYPVFKPGVRLGRAVHNITISYIGDAWHLLTPRKRYPEFKTRLFGRRRSISYEPSFYAGRANQWNEHLGLEFWGGGGPAGGGE